MNRVSSFYIVEREEGQGLDAYRQTARKVLPGDGSIPHCLDSARIEDTGQLGLFGEPANRGMVGTRSFSEEGVNAAE